MEKDLRIFILAYQDNAVGHHFIKAFIKSGVMVTGVVLETGAGGGIMKRIKKKMEVDGLKRTLFRLLQVNMMRIFKQNISAISKRHGIDVFDVHKFNSKKCRKLLSSLEVDLLVIASAPILKKFVFEQSRLGCLNAHPGWLPKYRGLGANAYALKNGDTPGVTVHFIDAGVDTGEIITREKIEIKKNDTVARINDRAVARGAVLVTEVIKKIQNGLLNTMTIQEPVGENYQSMIYRDVKQVNKRLKEMIN